MWKKVKERAVPRIRYSQAFFSLRTAQVLSVLCNCCWVREHRLKRLGTELFWKQKQACLSAPFSALCLCYRPHSHLRTLLAPGDKASSFRIFLGSLSQMSFQVPGCPADSAVSFRLNRVGFNPMYPVSALQDTRALFCAGRAVLRVPIPPARGTRLSAPRGDAASPCRRERDSVTHFPTLCQMYSPLCVLTDTSPCWINWLRAQALEMKASQLRRLRLFWRIFSSPVPSLTKLNPLIWSSKYLISEWNSDFSLYFFSSWQNNSSEFSYIC